jgi:hypothetical protein
VEFAIAEFDIEKPVLPSGVMHSGWLEPHSLFSTV